MKYLLKPDYLFSVNRNNKNKTESFLTSHAIEAHKIDPTNSISYYYKLFKDRINLNNKEMKKRIRKTLLDGVFKDETIDV